jgi:hypothetical protein
MAYSDLNQNQTVSLNSLQSGVSQGVFTAKTTIPSGTKQVTKSEASTYININTSLPSFNSKSSNELITKQDLSGITSAYSYLMYAVDGTSAYKSIDGGATWTVLSGLPSLAWYGIAGDSTGTNIAVIRQPDLNNQIYISNNGGVTFNLVTLSYILIGFYPTGVAMSNNGQYIAVSGCSTTSSQGNNRNVRIAVSNDYGASFSAGSYTDGTGLNLYNTSGKISVSGNGQYMTAVFAYNVSPGFPNVDRPWSFRVYSSNYGASWTKSSTSEFCGFADIALDYTGQNQFITSDWQKPGFFGNVGVKAFVSNNYGSSWSEKFSNTTAYYLGGASHVGFNSATITDDGKTMVGATNENSWVYYGQSGLSPLVISSTNYGTGSFILSEGYVGNAGIAGGTALTSGVSNNYIGMMLKNIGQFNYSINGGISFVPKVSGYYSWYQVYRKAFLYTTGGNTTYYTWYISEPQTSSCSGFGYYPITVYSNNPSFLSGAIFYTNTGLTNRFNGLDSWYMDSNFESGCTIQIGTLGQTIDQGCC